VQPDVALDLDEVMRWVNFAYPLTARGSLHVCGFGNWSGRVVHRGENDWYPEQLTSYVESQDRRGAQGVYLAGCTMRPSLQDHIAKGGSRRGEDAHYAVGIWSDIDFGTLGHKPGQPDALPLPPNQIEAATIPRLAGLVEPTAWIHSGGGLYGWWLLDEPIRVTKEFAGLVVEWQAALGRGAASQGWRYGEGVHDLARVLRLPGTVNRKAPESPRRCRILSTGGPRYDLADLLATADRVRPARPTPVAPTAKPFKGQGSTYSPRPGEVSVLDDFEARTSWDELIELAGGTFGRNGPNGERQWVRPGKTLTEGISATTGYDPARDRIKVFTDAWPPFVQGEVYTKPGFLAALQFSGDHSALARHLAAKGFGTPRPNRSATMTTPVPPAANEPWEDPLPLGWRAGGLPVFPAEVLPPRLRRFTVALAEATQTPIDLCGCAVLGICAAAVAGRVDVQARKGWVEPTNLFVVPVLEPGQRKSAVVTAVRRPLDLAAAELVASMADLIRDMRVERLVKERYAEKLVNDAAKSGDPMAIMDAQEAAAAVETIEVPAHPRLTINDSTPESFVSAMAEQGGRVAGITTEAGIFDSLIGRYTAKSNLDHILMAHAGDAIQVDRRGRPPEYIPRPALTMLASIQPYALQEMVRRPEFAGRGLLARILWALPVDNVGYRNVDAEPVDDATDEAYVEHLRAVIVALAGRKTSALVVTTPGARRVLRDYEIRIEHQLRPGAELGTGLVRQWGSKLAGAVVRIAGQLHVFSRWPDWEGEPVDEATMLAAVRLGEYFTAHAIAALTAGDSEATKLARTALAVVIRKEWGTFRLRDFQRAAPRGDLQKAAEAKRVLDGLVDGGWLRHGEAGYLPHPNLVELLHTADSADSADKGMVSAGQQLSRGVSAPADTADSSADSVSGVSTAADSHSNAVTSTNTPVVSTVSSVSRVGADSVLDEIVEF
jgi:replicative DNA helicase